MTVAQTPTTDRPSLYFPRRPPLTRSPAQEGPAFTMTDPIAPPVHRDPDLPRHPVCTGCAVPLAEPYGWCANCRAAYCPACGAGHYCTATCPTAGCHAGLCVRLVRDGQVLRDSWGMVE